MLGELVELRPVALGWIVGGNPPTSPAGALNTFWAGFARLGRQPERGRLRRRRWPAATARRYWPGKAPEEADTIAAVRALRRSPTSD